MPNTQALAALGERIAALEAQEERAAEDRHRKWEVLNEVRDKVESVSSGMQSIAGQQALITDRLNAMGQMVQVARDFIDAERNIPTRAEFAGLKDEIHAANLATSELRTEFRLVKESRDASVSRMWTVITGALIAGIGSAVGLVVTWITKH